MYLVGRMGEAHPFSFYLPYLHLFSGVVVVAISI